MAALGLMAYMATVAHAVDTKLWDESGSKITVNKTVEGSVLTGTETLFLVSAQNLIIHCKKIVVDNGLLLPSGLGTGTILFSECKTLQNGVFLEDCEPGTAGVTTAAVKVEQILHNSRVYLLFSPQAGLPNPFTKLHFGPLCALPNDVEITGHLVAQCLEPANTVESCSAASRVTHNISEAPETLFTGDVLKYGKNVALLDGTASLKLASGNAWKGWF